MSEFIQEWPRCPGKIPPSFDGVDEMNLLGWARAVPCVWGMDQIRKLGDTVQKEMRMAWAR